MTSISEYEEVSSFTQTSSIPLTTIFTPNKDCTDDDAWKTLTGADYVWHELDDGILKTTCYPSSYVKYQYNSNDWYSPGVCPLSYVYVVTSVVSQGDEPATTFAVCCPPQAPHIISDGWSCRITPTSSVDDTITRTTETVWWANPISVAWQESDLSLFSPKSAPLLALQSARVTFPSETTTESNTVSESASSESKTGDRVQETSSGSGDTGGGGGGGLSSGAAAGIGVGAAIGGMMIMGAIWWLTRRYKAVRKDRNIGEDGQTWVQQVYKVPDTTTQPHVVTEAHRDEVQS